MNEPRKQKALIDKGADWNRLCSAMDAVGDTEYAIDAHRRLARGIADRDSGTMYLAHYGLMQALYLQQMAVSDLCSALGYAELAKRVQDELDHVKQLRNDVAHMTNRRGQRFLGIVQVSMTPLSFELYSFGANAVGFEQKLIKVVEVVREQRRVLSKILAGVLQNLKREEREHRAQFKDESLSAHFDKLGYPFEKVFAGASHIGDQQQRNSDVAMGRVMLPTIAKHLEAFREALRKRGWFPDVHFTVDHDLETAENAIRRLTTYFETPPPERVDAEAMAQLLYSTVEKLKETAVDLDRSYSEGD